MINRITPERLEEVIATEEYFQPKGTSLTICVLTLENGFNVTGESASASLDNFDEELGKKLARIKAKEKIWPLEGYLLKQKLHDNGEGDYKFYSQLGQDKWVLEMTGFKRGGYFVEFGATNGKSLSNTYILEKKFDWQGLCAEPNPSYFTGLVKNRTCTVRQDCIGQYSGEQVEFIFANVYGGMKKHQFSDQHAEKRQPFVDRGNTGVLTTISLHDFLLANNAPKQIDYVSIDTEGSEYEILKHFPFEKWDISLFTIEHNYTEQRGKIFELMTSHGYSRKMVEFDDWYYRGDVK